MMKGKDMRGFSIIELLIVCVVVGIIATIAVPNLQRAIRATENGNTFATLRTISSTQAGYYSQNGRFGRVTEINNLLSSAIGTTIGNDVIRGKFVLSMSPATPTDAQLRTSYTINASRNVTGEDQVFLYELTPRELRQILP
jgi:prepilin-type N-terminal cleavage/methylation domain-containing protein